MFEAPSTPQIASAGPPAGEPRATFSYAATHDVDEQAALLRGWNQSYAQLSAGPFKGNIAETSFSAVHLFMEQTDSELFQTGELPSNLCAVGVPLRLGGVANFCGAETAGEALHVFSGRSGFEFYTPSGLIMAGIVVDIEDLAASLSDDEYGGVLSSLGDAHLHRAQLHLADGIRRQIVSAFEVIRDHPHLADNPQHVNAMKAALVSTLAQALAGDQPVSRSTIAPAKRWLIVATARALIMDHPDTPMTIADLCRAFGISRRNLQYCFQDVLGISPASFLRIVRLNGARQAIKTSKSVTDAATMWGFWHFGRFAHDYKTMFGELPSETYRRSHGVIATRFDITRPAAPAA